MKILQVSPSDISGGAEKIAYDLFEGYRKRGFDSWLAVQNKKTLHQYVLKIPQLSDSDAAYKHLLWSWRMKLASYSGQGVGAGRLGDLLDAVVRPAAARQRAQGREDFDFPGSRQLLQLLPARPDVVNLHNLHGTFFDLTYLADLSNQLPVLLTLHDEWLYTGHCAYALGCPKWEYGCGSCPDLLIYPPLKRDGTARNWTRKQAIYASSKLNIVTPSRWLMGKVERSMLTSVKQRVIPNGVDLTTYHPICKSMARRELGLPEDEFILLFVAQLGRRNLFKDYKTIETALSRLDPAEFNKEIIFLALGGLQDQEEKLGSLKIKHLGFQDNPKKVAQYYQAADIYLHAAHSDNFPTTILEALACGTSVVATNVGGISEQIDHGETGFLVQPRDSDSMAGMIKLLLQDDELRQRMSERAAAVARQRFDLNTQVDAYLEWYQEVIQDWPGVYFNND